MNHSLEIRVPSHGELRESVKERLLRIRDAFAEAKTYKEKQKAMRKLTDLNKSLVAN